MIFVKKIDKDLEPELDSWSMQISLEQAKAFCSVVDFGGYTPAAEQLHKSHSALIYLVKTLESQCNFVLFDRQGYRNTLTPLGRQIYLKCTELLQKSNELHNLCLALQEGWEPSLKIVYDGILPFAPFLQIYKDFRSANIPTVVQTHSNYLDEVETSFYGLGADIMISILPGKKNTLQSVFLKSFKSHLVAHKNHPIHKNSKKRWTLEELKSFYFLTIRGATYELGLNTREIEKTASFYLSDFSAKRSAILEEIGFGWLPEHLIVSELKNRTLIPIRWERESYHIVQPIMHISKTNSLGPAAQLAFEILDRALGGS
jgi:DNA-binding transcriptional LysR family regulator